MHRSLAALALVSLLPLARPAVAQSGDEPGLATTTSAIVYGQDDRVEVADHPDADVQALARASIVTLVPLAGIDVGADGSVDLYGSTLQQSFGLCPDERFANQITAGFCSGTLIAPDLVLTAGHCVSPEAGRCDAIGFLFGYEHDGTSLATLGTDDIYTCRRVVAHALEDGSDGKRDYAIVQLDRAVAAPRQPATVSTGRSAIAEGTGLLMIGAPSGLPMKVEDGGSVRNSRSGVMDYFVATTDSFGGNSGSGVFRRDSLELVGILVEGDTDYVEADGCVRVNQCAEDGCGGENVLYAFHAIEDLCASDAEPTLCGGAATCGDGFCSAGEDAAGCPSDCTESVCGDGVCAPEDWQSCPDDCVLTPPDAWTCDVEWYGTLDGCDCGCGVYDPDCDLTGGDSPDCRTFQVCGDGGKCVGALSGREGAACAANRTRDPAAAGLLGLGALLLLRRRRR